MADRYRAAASSEPAAGLERGPAGKIQIGISVKFSKHNLKNQITAKQKLRWDQKIIQHMIQYLSHLIFMLAIPFLIERLHEFRVTLSQD